MTNLTVEEVNRKLKAKKVLSIVGKVAANVFIYFMLLLMYSPLIYIAVFSFTKADILGQWNDFSIDNYINLFKANNENARILWSAIKNTLLVAGLSALISTVLGTLGAIGIHYTRKKWLKSTYGFINQIPVVNAEIVTAISLCVLFILFTRLFNLPTSLFTVVLGHVVLSLPYVVLSVQPKLEQMDPSVYEAALDLGANQPTALWKVVVPDVIPGILTGFMLSITLSLDDYLITAFTKPDDGEFNTLSTFVDSTLARGNPPTILRAFTTLLFVVILIVMIVMNIKGIKDAKSINKKEIK